MHYAGKWLLLAAALTVPVFGAPVNTTDPTVISNFQSGATVITFDGLGGITPLVLDAFTNDTPVPNAALLKQQLQPGGGIGITSGGGIGGGVLSLQPPINGAARSGSGVLASAFNPNFTNGPQSTCFLTGCFMEFFFEQGVNRIGFWTNANVQILASSGDVTGVLATNTTNLENVNGTALQFVGVERAANEINFVQIFAGGNDFVIDDLTYGRVGATNVVPEPGSFALFVLSAAALLVRARRRR